jgi:rhamnogalacturonan endolyase
LRDKTTLFQKVGIADLNGDGVYDYVIKQPHQNIDPWHVYWQKSPDTYKIEAYLSDGTFLWSNDLGWAIERGIWYSPYIVGDLTGDGRAEVAAKIGEGDPRDEEGKVTSGPEYVVVWDGMTGREIARAPWPDRELFDSYNYASRNQIAIAYLDGKTPCLLTLRGTYNRMLVHAYQLRDGRLERLWEYDNEPYGGLYWGQGAHFTQCADIDGDGRDEVLLGSAVLDDNGAPLWSTGRGHPDAFYLTDILPAHPGMEIAYVIETRQAAGGGLNVVDARTGRTIWKLDEPTRHVHGKGMCANIDPTRPGCEVYGADADGHKLTENRWLFAADGTLLRRGTDCPWSFDISTVYWDADLQKEILRGSRISAYQGGTLAEGIAGRVILKADVLGDWREEIIASVDGELRIYTTPDPRDGSARVLDAGSRLSPSDDHERDGLHARPDSVVQSRVAIAQLESDLSDRRPHRAGVAGGRVRAGRPVDSRPSASGDSRRPAFGTGRTGCPTRTGRTVCPVGRNGSARTSRCARDRLRPLGWPRRVAARANAGANPSAAGMILDSQPRSVSHDPRY